jgi:lipopolysaccharide/colanic/teichoic acid biosynthesis glycosyltransferase
MLHLDIHYARNISWWLDLKIILMTIPALFLQVRDTYRARKSTSQSALRPRVAA